MGREIESLTQSKWFFSLFVVVGGMWTESAALVQWILWSTAVLVEEDLPRLRRAHRSSRMQALESLRPSYFCLRRNRVGRSQSTVPAEDEIPYTSNPAWGTAEPLFLPFYAKRNTVGGFWQEEIWSCYVVEQDIRENVWPNVIPKIIPAS